MLTKNIEYGKVCHGFFYPLNTFSVCTKFLSSSTQLVSGINTDRLQKKKKKKKG